MTDLTKQLIDEYLKEYKEKLQSLEEENRKLRTELMETKAKAKVLEELLEKKLSGDTILNQSRETDTRAEEKPTALLTEREKEELRKRKIREVSKALIEFLNATTP